jgi:hypothetical protein
MNRRLGATDAGSTLALPPVPPDGPGRAEALRALAAELVARLGAGGAGYVVAVVDEMLADAAEKGGLPPWGDRVR